MFHRTGQFTLSERHGDCTLMFFLNVKAYSSFWIHVRQISEFHEDLFLETAEVHQYWN